MHHNPALAQALARERVTELRQGAGTGVQTRRVVPRLRAIEAARRGAGWLLVDVGLRLALPRAAMKRPPVRAHR